MSGTDNYYNHYIYAGWQHWGMGIGNPLVMSPIYNDDGEIVFKSNRLQGHHLGIMGTPCADLQYRILLSFTRNWGTYSLPFYEIKKNGNALIELTYTPHQLKGWETLFLFLPDNLSSHIHQTSANGLRNNVRNKDGLSILLEHTRSERSSSYLNGFHRHLSVPLLVCYYLHRLG